MNALKPRPPFQVLIMSEESRLGREQIETAYVLKQIMDAGVRVFFYLEDRERTLDSAAGEGHALARPTSPPRWSARRRKQRTHDALLRKAARGHVAGGKVYGYRNVEVRRDRPAGPRAPRDRRGRGRGDRAGSSRRSRPGTGFRADREGAQRGGRPGPAAQPRLRAAWAPTAIREMLPATSTGGGSCGTRPAGRIAAGPR